MATIKYNQVDGIIPETAVKGTYLAKHKYHGLMLFKWQESSNPSHPGTYVGCGFSETDDGFAKPMGYAPFQFVILRDEQLALIEWHAHLGDL